MISAEVRGGKHQRALIPTMYENLLEKRHRPGQGIQYIGVKEYNA
jgi:hypothetical protein